MGASFFNFAVPTTDSTAVETLIGGWLERKGFVRRTAPPRFECDREEERCAFLVCSARWTVVLYSHAFEEGSRLHFELGKLRLPTMQVWVSDSDAWGWRIFRDRRVVDAFYFNPHAEIGDEEANQPTSGDPAAFCETFDLPDQVDELARIQRGRAVFMERVLEQFCGAVGASGAAVSYADLEAAYLGFEASRDLPDIRLRRLCFTRDGDHDAGAAASVNLHALQIQPPPETPRQDSGGAAPAIEAAPGLRLLAGMAGAASIVLQPLFWMIGAAARGCAHVFLRRDASRGERADALTDPAVAALFRDLPPSVRRDGPTLVNERHGCSITLPPDAVVSDALDLGAFDFKLGHVDVRCHVSPPGRSEYLRYLFQAVEGHDLPEDQTFFAGELPARAIYSRTTAAGRTWCTFHAVVQAPAGFFQFVASDRREIPPETRQRIIGIASSLRCRR